MKLQIPSSNIQRSTKLQATSCRRNVPLEFEAWNFSETWMLVLGAFSVLNL
jgi:hypothetical protein